MVYVCIDKKKYTIICTCFSINMCKNKYTYTMKNMGPSQNHRPHTHTHTHTPTLTHRSFSPHFKSTWNPCRVEQQESRISQPRKWRQLYSSGVQSIVPQGFATTKALRLMWVMFQHKSYSPVNMEKTKNTHTKQKTKSHHWNHIQPTIFTPFYWNLHLLAATTCRSKRQISNYLCDAPSNIKECPYRSAKIKGSCLCDCDKRLGYAAYLGIFEIS